MKKKILFIYKKKKGSQKINESWARDCKQDYDIQKWGRGYYEDYSLKSLVSIIDQFRPDWIYMTLRKRYELWLPDLTNIKVPKIFVEVDTCYYDVNDSWYKQFDILKCREPSWNGWDKIPLFRWSVPEIAFTGKSTKRSGIYFVGRYKGQTYLVRKELKQLLKGTVCFSRRYGQNYWNRLHSASALLCPTENYFGNYTPAKLLEYLASGAAVITNCDFNQAGIPEMEQYAIKYHKIKGVGGLKEALKMDFASYYNKACDAMRNHTHRMRYKELFG